MKKKAISLISALLLLFSMAGCGKKIKTELAMENIESMTVNAYGDFYILTDLGIRYYALSTDKEVDYIYGSDELNEAEFIFQKNGEEVTYSSFKIDLLMPAGDDGVTMVGRYMTNTAGRDSDLYVLQDAADLNYGAAYFAEITRDSEAKTPVLNGVGATDGGIYFKLNRSVVDRGDRYDNGISYSYMGSIEPYDVPDNVTAAVGSGSDVYFLVESKDEVKIVCNSQDVLTYDPALVADAFVSDKSFYAVYKSGRVTKWDIGGEETDFTDLGTKVSDVNGSVLWDGQLYWFDKDGIKTVKN